MNGSGIREKHTPLVAVVPAQRGRDRGGDRDCDDKTYDNGEEEEEVYEEEEDEEEEEDDGEEVLPDIEEVTLPKDVGEINVRGHLRFDEEMPPDEVTKNNTIHNALMYHMSHSHAEQGGAGKNVLKRQEKNIIEFDTFSANLDVHTFQMIKIVQDEGYVFHNMSKTWLVPYHDEKQSLEALEWALGELANNNDMVVVVKVVSLQTIMKIGVEEHRKVSEDMFRRVERIKSTKPIKLVMEVRIGAVDYMINKAIRDFDPMAIVMGTKGIKKASFTSFLVDDHSTTKRFLQHGKVPVVVLNPNLERTPLKPMNTEGSIRERLTLYPSVYDPITGMDTLAMERSISSDSGSGHVGGSSRTSRFLRMGKSLSRAGSPSSRSPSLNPTASNDRELRSVKSVDSANTLSPIRSNSSLRRALSPFRLFKR